MTTETGESKEVRGASGVEFQHTDVQQVVLLEEEKESRECNGIACEEAEDANDVIKDDVDSSYVFVNGDSDGLSEKDLDIVDKADLNRSQKDDPSLESDDSSERDLGEGSRVEISVANTEACAAENRGLTPALDVHLEGMTSEYKEFGKHNEEKRDSDLSTEVRSEKQEKVERNLENGSTCKQDDISIVDLKVATADIQNEISVDCITDGCSIPDPVPEIQDASSRAQECGELGNTKEASDGNTFENSYKSQEDVSESPITAHKIKVDSDSLGEGAKVVLEPLVNSQEINSLHSDENLPEDDLSHRVVPVIPLSDEENLASKQEDDSPSEKQVKINEDSSPHGDEEVQSSNSTTVYSASEQIETVATERSNTEFLNLGNEISSAPTDTEKSGSQSLPLLNKEEQSLNYVEEIPAVEQSMQSSLDQECEKQSPTNAGDIDREVRPISPVDEAKEQGVIDKDSNESCQMLSSCSDNQAQTEAEAQEVLAEQPVNSSICPADEISANVVCEVMEIEAEAGIESAESREHASALSDNDMDPRIVSEEISVEDKEFVCPSVNGSEPKADTIADSFTRHDHISAFSEVETRLEEREETVCAISDIKTTPCEKETGKNVSPILDGDTSQANVAQENASITPNDSNNLPVTKNSTLHMEFPRNEGKDDLVHAGGVKVHPELGNVQLNHGQVLVDEVQLENKNDSDAVVIVKDDGSEEGAENKALEVSPNDAGNLSMAEQKLETEAKSVPIFIVRVPRFSDDKLKLQIQHAQKEVDEKTEIRGSIRLEMQKQKAVRAEYWQKVDDARKEEREARNAVASRRQELEYIQSFLNKLKNASSISDLDNRIHKLQKKISHETNTLKEEKSIMREMNQLKMSREQLSSSLASDDELQKAFEKQEEMETRVKHLKEEIDTLRKGTQQAEANTKDAKSKYDSQCEHIRDLQSQFKAADDLRQEAYRRLKNLKKEAYLKNEHFYSYKDDLKVATNYIFSGDREALRRHCNNQVEKLMELWNKNDEFRQQYVKANLPSTLRRFRTLDARSIGPDDEPVMIHQPIEREQKENIVPQRISSNHSPALPAEREEKNKQKTDTPLPAAKTNSTNGPILPQKSQPPRSKKVTKPVTKDVVPNGESDKEAEKETKRSVEEEEQAKKDEELARKEEELRKAKQAAEMKEQLRLEQIAKAKEAEERKKRKAEKAHAKAEIRAQKEAELKEKKREKKERKKEKKPTPAATEDIAESETPVPDAEISPESVQEQSVEKTTTAAHAKRSSRPRALAAKEYNKVKPLPAPLRNRGKRKMQTWMWVLVIAVVFLALFMAGNYVSFSKFGLRNISS